MAKAKNKTVVSKESVASFVNSLSANERQTAKILLELFKETTKMKPRLWGTMIGFGSYHYKYESGREGDFFATGFAMRKSGPTLYIMPGYQDYGELLKKLGPHKLGKSCLYLKSLDGIDQKVLKTLIKTGLKDLGEKYRVTPSP